MKRLILLLIFIYIFNHSKSQVKYTGRFETGYHLFGSRPIRLEPGSGWRGYQLDESPNGIEASLVNGISYKSRLMLGLGVGYLNYEGINRYTVYGDLEYSIPSDGIFPVFELKIGSSHINNQYENGNTDTFVDLSGGFEREISKKISLQLKAGFRTVHQSIFFM